MNGISGTAQLNDVGTDTRIHQHILSQIEEHRIIEADVMG